MPERSRGRSCRVLVLFVFLGVALPARAQDQSIAAYVNPEGTVGNQEFTGSLGMDFDVNLDIMITHLGVFDSGSDGLNLPITARLYEREFQDELASIEFTPDEPGELIDGSRYKELDEPIELTAGDPMTMSAAGYGAGEPNGNQGGTNLGLFTDAGPCSITFVGGGRYGDPGTPELFPGIMDGGPANRYAAGTFLFTPLEELDGATGGIAYVVPEFTFGNQSWLGTLGLDFNVLQSIQVTRLGVFDSGSDGPFRDITVRIFDRSSQQSLVSLEFTVDDPGDLEEGSTFLDLETPLVLPAGFQGSIVAVGYGDEEQNGNVGGVGVGTMDTGGCAIEFVGGGRFGDPAGLPDAFPTNVDGGPANRYGAGTFEFEPFEGEVAEPNPPTDVTATAGEGEVVVSWTASAMPPEIAGYVVVQTVPGPPVRLNADLITETSLTLTGLCGGVEVCFTVNAVGLDDLSSVPSEEVCATPTQGAFPEGEFTAYVVPEEQAGNQDFAGALGLDFITNAPIVITQFGVFDDLSDGLVAPINARLYDLETGVELASLDFTPDDPGEPEGGSLFKELDAPLSLPEGFQGSMVASGYGAGDRNGNGNNLGWTTDSGGCLLTFVGGGRFGDQGNPLGFPDSLDGGPENRYAAGTFVYSGFAGGETPEPPENLTADLADGGTVELSWQAPAGGAAVSGYNVYRVSPPPTRRLNADLLTGTSFTTEAFASGVEVCFAVRSVAVDGGFESANSNEPCVQIPTEDPEPAGTIRAYDVVQGTVGGQNFETPLGLDFDVDLDIEVTHLGVFDSSADGLQRTIIATLYDRGVVPEEPLATLEFTPDDPGNLYGGSRFKELDEPLDLGGGGMYSIVAEGYGAGEPNGNNAPGWSTNRGPCSISFVGGGRFGDVPGEFPPNVDGGPANRYAAGTFLFNPLEVVDEASGGIAYEVPEFTVGNQEFTGSLGMDFNIQTDILLTRIGVFDSGSDGLVLPITAQLFDRDTEEELIRIEFTPDDSGDPEDGSTFKDLDPPMLLRSGFHGTISAAGYGPGEPNGNGALGLTTDDGGCAIEFVGGGRFGDPGTPGSFPNSVDGGPVNRYASGTFEFEPVPVGETVFHRGDSNGDGSLNIADGVHTLNFLFSGGPDSTCKESQDFNNDGSTNIADAVAVFGFLFQSGPPPAAPGPTTEPCGPDPDEPGSPGDLGCDEYTGC